MMTGHGGGSGFPKGEMGTVVGIGTRELLVYPINVALLIYLFFL
jgi:hypothetical protein